MHRGHAVEQEDTGTCLEGRRTSHEENWNAQNDPERARIKCNGMKHRSIAGVHMQPPADREWRMQRPMMRER